MTFNSRNYLMWLIVGLLATAVLSLGAAFAPHVAKRLLLFHGLFGLAGGLLLGWLLAELGVLHPIMPESTGESEASRRKLSPAWLVSSTGAAILILGGINMAWISSHQFRKTQQEQSRRQPEQAAALELLGRMSQDDPELAARYDEERRKLSPTFGDYLAHRVSSLGSWQSPWPTLFWLGELLLAAAIGGWILFRRATAG